MENKKLFILTCWDGDMYILTGYDSPEEIRERIAGLDWATMPNGAQIKTSSIAKIQSHDDYRFQSDQKYRHKKLRQYLNGKDADKWNDPALGFIKEADTKSISGKIKNLPQIGDSKK